MRAVVQRVSRAQARVGDRISGEIGLGLAVLLGVGASDTASDAQHMAEKLVHLRIFADQAGLMNFDVREIAGSLLLVSQFTLFGDTRKGRRPSFTGAAREEQATHLYRQTGEEIGTFGVTVAYGVFGAHMEVELVNDGPVTILIDTKKIF